MSREPVFRLEDVTVSYDGKPAVSEVTMDIYRNAITALHRPLGLRQVDPDPLPQPDERPDPLGERRRAASLYHGEDIYADQVDPVEVRKRIGMVFQKPNPFPKSIYDNIAFGPRILGMEGDMDEIVERALHGARSGTRSRTDSTRTRSGCRAASSSGSASPAASPSTRT